MQRKPLPAPSGIEAPKLRAISFSRDSDGKDERLRKWRENGPKKKTHNQRAHEKNRRFTALKHNLDVVHDVSSCECAADVGVRGDEIIETCRRTDAKIVIIPSLRRLGVGVAQIQLRRMIERAGLMIVSEDDAQNAILRSDPSPTREKLLMDFATTDEFEWATAKRRLADAHFDYWASAEGAAVLAFVSERPHLSLSRLGAILESRGYRTARGSERWFRQTVQRARREAAVRNAAAPLQEASG